jgi:DMSO/TMAO reductase YedYZ molybdopterin-dependent catalytic subunit
MKKERRKNRSMANIMHALRKASFAATKPLVKYTIGKPELLSTEEVARTPPGQTVTDRFPVLHHETKHELPTAEEISAWRLVVDGLVEKELSLSLGELRTLVATTELTADMHCVTGWTRFDNRWSGARMRDILA